MCVQQLTYIGICNTLTIPKSWMTLERKEKIAIFSALHEGCVCKFSFGIIDSHRPWTGIIGHLCPRLPQWAFIEQQISQETTDHPLSRSWVYSENRKVKPCSQLDLHLPQVSIEHAQLVRLLTKWQSPGTKSINSFSSVAQLSVSHDTNNLPRLDKHCSGHSTFMGTAACTPHCLQMPIRHHTAPVVSLDFT